MEFGSTITTLVLGSITFLVFPVTLGRILKKYQMNYDTKQFDKVYGALKEGLVSQSQKILLIYNLSFLVRRALTVMVIVLLRGSPGLQPPLLLILSTLFMALMLQNKTFSENAQYKLEIFNELFVWLCSLSFFIMTEYVEEY
jgi:hypothetical protein